MNEDFGLAEVSNVVKVESSNVINKLDSKLNLRDIEKVTENAKDLSIWYNKFLDELDNPNATLSDIAELLSTISVLAKNLGNIFENLDSKINEQ